MNIVALFILTLVHLFSMYCLALDLESHYKLVSFNKYFMLISAALYLLICINNNLKIKNNIAVYLCVVHSVTLIYLIAFPCSSCFLLHHQVDYFPNLLVLHSYTLLIPFSIMFTIWVGRKRTW